MKRALVACMVFAFLMGACGQPGEPELDMRSIVASTAPLLPDTVTVAGVLEMRHGLSAFDRAPQYTIDSVPLVVVDAREQVDFDLTHVPTIVPLADGRFAALRSLGGGWLMLFDADGAPERVLARTGQGPGELIRAAGPLVLTGDTIVVIEDANRQLNRYLPDAGLVHGAAIRPVRSAYCFRPAGVLPGSRVVSSFGCSDRYGSDSAYRLPVPVIVTDLGYGSLDTITIAQGPDMVPLEVHFSRREVIDTWLRFGRTARVAAWDSVVAVATGDAGYVLEQWSVQGSLLGRVLVEVRRRPVTETMRRAEIDRELARIDGPQSEPHVNVAESRRVARDTPFADSLPPYQALIPGEPGILWVTDYTTLVDSTSAVTAFRRDGAIVARLTIPKLSQPVWFDRDRVILRMVDDDGVVRFPVYRIIPRRGGS